MNGVFLGVGEGMVRKEWGLVDSAINIYSTKAITYQLSFYFGHKTRFTN